MRRLIFSLCVIGLIFGGVVAQENVPSLSAYVLVYEGEVPVNPSSLRWSPDGNTLTFSVRGDPMYYAYSLSTQELLLPDTNPNPALISLTPAEQELYRAARDYAYMSPDGQYMVYYSQEQISRSTQSEHDPVEYVGVLALGRRMNETYRLLDYTPLYDTGFESSYSIRWSDDSLGFVIQNYPMYGDGTTLDFVSIENTFVVRVPGVIADLETVFDISAANYRLLLPWYTEFEGTLRRGLVLWDASQIKMFDYDPNRLDEITVIADEQVVGAAFAIEDSQQIFVINQSGIVLHNLDTGENSVLDASVTSDWVLWAVFSPDRQSIAVLSYRESTSGIYIIPFTPATP